MDTSLTRMSSIEDYLCGKIFLRDQDFRSVMSSESYKHVRAALRFDSRYNHDIAIVMCWFTAKF